jgi:hypothetical protein
MPCLHEPATTALATALKGRRNNLCSRAARVRDDCRVGSSLLIFYAPNLTSGLGTGYGRASTAQQPNDEEYDGGYQQHVDERADGAGPNDPEHHAINRATAMVYSIAISPCSRRSSSHV